LQSVVDENDKISKIKYDDLAKDLNLCKSSYNSLLNWYNKIYNNYGLVVQELHQNTMQLKEVSTELESIMMKYESEYNKLNHLDELFTKAKIDIKNVQKKVFVEKRKNRILQTKFDLARPLMLEATTPVELVDIFKFYF
jgi:chromosome segregation ATPase